MVVSLFKIGQVQNALGQQTEAAASLTACFDILDELHSHGRLMDNAMKSLYEQLSESFAREK